MIAISLFHGCGSLDCLILALPLSLSPREGFVRSVLRMGKRGRAGGGHGVFEGARKVGV